MMELGIGEGILGLGEGDGARDRRRNAGVERIGWS